jgi:hypothetical protein
MFTKHMGGQRAKSERDKQISESKVRERQTICLSLSDFALKVRERKTICLSLSDFALHKRYFLRLTSSHF